jgi:SpoVK/Ycf46/Vps4 family AAA+-type ATPase
VRDRLLETVEPFQTPSAFSQRALRLDSRIAGLMLDSGELDDALNGWVDLSMPADDATCESVPAHISERTLRLAASCFGDGDANIRPVFHLHGRSGAGRRSLARYVCGQMGLPLLIADVRKLPSHANPVDALWRLGREALLHPAAIYLANFDDLLEDRRREEREAFLDSAAQYAPLTFLSGSAPWNPPLAVKKRFFVDIECPAPDAGARIELWSKRLGNIPHALEEQQIREVAAEFQFTHGQIHEAYLVARAHSIWRDDPPPPLTAADIQGSCRLQATPHLGGLARKIQAAGSWEDLILPDRQKDQLQEIVAQVRRSQIVLGKWGFGAKYPYGLGLAALFEGTSGTGKTFAAGIIAAELGLDIYKIDLAGVVNKYIGETEKNLSRIFDEARDSNTILFFDEAEALFAKRSETVKDANDRYAGVETAHLLQRLESHTGIVILATNMKQNLDEAFIRRFRFIIHFPFPDEADRERMWRRVFPEAAPLAPDVDFRWLARRLKLPAGHIRNIGLRAAFLAAERQGAVDMDSVLDAARREIEKMGKVYNPADFRFRGNTSTEQLEPEVA